MAAPADPRFATDATFDADGETWASDPNKVDPGAPRIAEGFEPTTLPAEWLNYWFNRIGAWLFYIGESASRTLRISPQRGFGTSSVQDVANCWTAEVFGDGFKVVSDANFAKLHFSIADMIPNGATITRIRAAVKPGAARTSTDRMSLYAWDLGVAWPTAPAATPVTVSAANDLMTIDYDDGTTAAQVLDSGAVTLVNDRANYQIIVQIMAGNDGGSNEDEVYGLEITYTGPKIWIED